MGGNQSELPKTFDYTDWTKKKQDSWAAIKRRPQHGSFSVYKKELLNEEVEEYFLRFEDEQELTRQQLFFQWRSRQPALVNGKHFYYEKLESCCSENYTGHVYLEHIPLRLNDIYEIPYPDNLFVTHSALQGFQKLVERVGCFSVSSEMICMDRNGKVKAWLHADLSRIQPQFPTSTTSSNIEAMVHKIIDMVSNSTSPEQQPTLASYLYRRPLNFITAKRAIKQYAELKHIAISNYFDSLLEEMEKMDQKEEDSHNTSEEYDHLDSLPPQLSYQNNFNYGASVISQLVHSSHIGSETFQSQPKRKTELEKSQSKLSESPRIFETSLSGQQPGITYLKENVLNSNSNRFERSLPLINSKPSLPAIKFQYCSPQVNRASLPLNQPYRPSSPSFTPSLSPSFTPSFQPYVTVGQSRRQFHNAEKVPQREKKEEAALQVQRQQKQQIQNEWLLIAGNPSAPSPLNQFPNSPTNSLGSLSGKRVLLYSDSTGSHRVDQEIIADMFKYFGEQIFT